MWKVCIKFISNLNSFSKYLTLKFKDEERSLFFPKNSLYLYFYKLGKSLFFRKFSILEILVKIQINEYIPWFMYISFSKTIGMIDLPALVKLEVFIIYHKTTFDIKGIKSRFTAFKLLYLVFPKLLYLIYFFQ